MNNYRMQTPYEDEDEKGRITKKFIEDLLKSNFRQYYRTKYLNEVIYLHHKGFKKIENIEDLTGLTCLHLQENSITFPILILSAKVIRKIENLENLECLTNIYLQENLISKIEGFDKNLKLDTVQLTSNMIETIENLDHLTRLNSLYLKSNHIGKNGPSDYEHLAKLKTLHILDLQQNRINDIEFIDVLKQMPELRVLYTQGNPFTSKIKFFKKVVIHQLPKLNYLDDRPVFPEDRRYAEAFHRGGLPEERLERKKVQQEKKAWDIQRVQDYKDMIKKAREERLAREEIQKQQRDSVQEPLQSESDSQNLETYYTEETDKSKESSRIDTESDVRSLTGSEDEQIKIEKVVEEKEEEIPELEDAEEENYLDELE